MTRLNLCLNTRRLKAAAICAAGLIALAGPADAMCRWTFVNGHQQQICDNTIDIPAIRPPAIAPILPPSIPPIQQPMIPPIGTTSCHQSQIWNGTSYQWGTVCR